jgi:hypothetical protein
MPKYAITGVDKESGLDTDLVLDAPTAGDAAMLADKRGCTVLTIAEQRQPKSLRGAGWSGITLFVVFVITLLSFGRAPAGQTARGYVGFDINIISCLGIGFGIYAVFFLLRFRTVLKLPPVKKVLGLIGAVGLIAHSLIAVLAPLGPVSPQAEAVGAGANWVMARAGAEQWMIDGKAYLINGSYLLKLSDGVQYTIEYPCQFGPSGPPQDDANALQIAFPLMKHAYEHDLYRRLHVTKLGSGELVPDRIGVVLFEKLGDQIGGYKVWLGLGEIQRRAQNAVPMAPTSQP